MRQGSSTIPPETSPDDDDFPRFLDQHYPLLLGYLRRRMQASDEAEDIAQESFERLMRYRGQPAAALKQLLFRIALNILADRGRRELVVQAQSGQLMAELGEEVAPASAMPDHYAAQQQELLMVREAIGRLPELCRRTYLLNRLDGLSYPQIAMHHGVSVKAVEKQMSKALTLIDRHLKARGAETVRSP